MIYTSTVRSDVDIAYCNKECCVGKEMSRKLLEEENSAHDAAINFVFFTEKCFDTCPYKNEHKKLSNDN